jgi:hypothetical protein
MKDFLNGVILVLGTIAVIAFVIALFYLFFVLWWVFITVAFAALIVIGAGISIWDFFKNGK